MIDDGFEIQVLSSTANPQLVSYLAMHQDYSEGFVGDLVGDGQEEGFVRDPFRDGFLGERVAGERLVRLCLSRGHWGVIEHPQMVVAVKGFPHSTMQQLRTHRHLSFDVQSGRYTGKRLVDFVKGADDHMGVEDLFWVRKPGVYVDRMGNRLVWNALDREREYQRLITVCQQYAEAVDEGMPYEMARDLYIPYCVRQNFVMSGNLRAILHLMELRGTADAELECQEFTRLMKEVVRDWVPEVFEWWEKVRDGKNRRSP